MEAMDMNPLALWVSSILGTILMAWYALYLQKDIYDNRRRLFSALMLVICLSCYAYNVIGLYLKRISILDRVQK